MPRTPDDPNPVLEAHVIGHAAGRDDAPLLENPYNPGTDLHRSWTRGHVQGSKERHSFAGTYGISDDERARLRAQARPDPTAILDEPPVRFPGEQDPAPARSGLGGIPTVDFTTVGHVPAFPRAFVDRDPDPDALNDFVQKLSGFITSALDDLASYFADFAEALARVLADHPDEEIAKALGLDLDAFRTAYKALGIDRPDPEPQALARKRHGHAATCPRHGPTRGGTCMKCARGRR